MSVNLAPEPTIPAVELVNGVLPLLKTTKGPMQGVELRLNGATVVALQILPHLPSSGKLRHLSRDLKCDGLADDHLGRKSSAAHFSSFFSKASRTAGEMEEEPSGASKEELEVSER